jgi:hypothetical protein
MSKATKAAPYKSSGSAGRFKGTVQQGGFNGLKHERLTAPGYTHTGEEELSVTLNLVMTRLKNPLPVMNRIHSEFSFMEATRFANNGAAPEYGISKKWAPISEETWQRRQLRFPEAGTAPLNAGGFLREAAVNPKLKQTPTGKSIEMEIDPRNVAGSSYSNYNEGWNYGLRHQNGGYYGGNWVPQREFVTITLEFRAIAFQIAKNYFLAPTGSLTGGRAIQTPQEKKMRISPDLGYRKIEIEKKNAIAKELSLQKKLRREEASAQSRRQAEEDSKFLGTQRGLLQQTGYGGKESQAAVNRLLRTGTPAADLGRATPEQIRAFTQYMQSNPRMMESSKVIAEKIGAAHFFERLPYSSRVSRMTESIRNGESVSRRGLDNITRNERQRTGSEGRLFPEMSSNTTMGRFGINELKTINAHYSTFIFHAKQSDGWGKP